MTQVSGKHRDREPQARLERGSADILRCPLCPPVCPTRCGVWGSSADLHAFTGQDQLERSTAFAKTPTKVLDWVSVGSYWQYWVTSPWLNQWYCLDPMDYVLPGSRTGDSASFLGLSAPRPHALGQGELSSSKWKQGLWPGGAGLPSEKAHHIRPLEAQGCSSVRPSACFPVIDHVAPGWERRQRGKWKTKRHWLWPQSDQSPGCVICWPCDLRQVMSLVSVSSSLDENIHLKG